MALFLFTLKGGVYMLVVTDLTGKSEILTDITGAEITEEVNGGFSFSFSCLETERNSHSYPLLQEESIVELEGHEYRVKNLVETLKRKVVIAPHTFFDLIDTRKEDIFGGTKTLNEFVTFALSGTGWTFENVDVTGSQLITNFGKDNVVALVRTICTAFSCEVKIEAGKKLKFIKLIGEDNDVQFRYGHNIKTLKKTVDTSKLSTVIKGYGADGLEVTYTSPNYAKYGERHAEPVVDDRFTIADSLAERLKQEIVDEPEVSITLEAILLGFESNLGDKVWLIYEPLNTDFQTRIVAQKRFPFAKKSPIVTLSNQKRTFADLLTETKIEIRENQKQVSSKIEQTNERITLEVTSIDGRFTETEARIEIAEGLIEQKVSLTDYNGNTITSLITQDPYSISFLAQELNLEGLVTFTNLDTPGATVIDGGNIKANSISADRFYGNLFTVGNGSTTTKMELFTDDNNAHYIKSNQAAGFRVESTGSLSLVAGSSYGIYTRGAPLVAENGFRASGTSQFNNGLSVNGTLYATTIYQNGYQVADIYHTHSQYAEWYDTYSIRRGGSAIKFIYGSAKIQARDYWDSAYGTFEGLAYSNVSRRELKRDIEPFANEALALILDTPVYSYRYNNDLDVEPKRVGLIFDESPMEIMEFSGGIDIYAMATLAWKAIQELNAKIEGSYLSA